MDKASGIVSFLYSIGVDITQRSRRFAAIAALYLRQSVDENMFFFGKTAITGFCRLFIFLAEPRFSRYGTRRFFDS
jgi:hypothetical protein